jgi:hypothetical protein
MSTETSYRLRTTRGVVHAVTEGRTFRIQGFRGTNRAEYIGQRGSKADCNALVSSGAVLTDEPVNCTRCVAAQSR